MNIRKPWEELKFSSRMKAYYEKDPRVPIGYKPSFDSQSRYTSKTSERNALTRQELVTLRRGPTTIQVPRWFLEGGMLPENMPTIRRVHVSKLGAAA